MPQWRMLIIHVCSAWRQRPALGQLLLVLALLCSPRLAGAAETFTMAFGGDPAQQPLFRFYELLYSEAFKRLGFTFTYKVYPSKRSSVMANDGEVDGEPQRAGNYADTYPNMIRVDEPSFTNRVVAFATDPSIRLNSWDSLRDTPYRVDYRIGSLISEQELPRRVDPKLLTAVPTVEQILKKLKFQRTDIYVDMEWAVLPVLQSAEFKEAGIVRVGILSTNLSYPFVHKKHAALAPRLAVVLRQMKQEGVYDRLLKQATTQIKP